VCSTPDISPRGLTDRWHRHGQLFLRLLGNKAPHGQSRPCLARYRFAVHWPVLERKSQVPQWLLDEASDRVQNPGHYFVVELADRPRAD